MTANANTTDEANSADDNPDEPQPQRELAPARRRYSSALTAEQLVELMGRFRQRFGLTDG